MAISSNKITAFTNVNVGQSARPALTVLEIQQLLDSSPEELRVALNSLIDGLLATTDGNSGADNIYLTAIAGLTGSTVQEVLESIKTAIDDATTGTLPDNSITEVKMANDMKKAIANGVASLDATGNVPVNQLDNVGLDNVDNYATANQTEAETGTATDRFMTPERTTQTINESTHVKSTSNPHSVTKSQLGLGNVDNYLTANKEQAELGTDNDKFMTPERTKEAIDELQLEQEWELISNTILSADTSLIEISGLNTYKAIKLQLKLKSATTTSGFAAVTANNDASSKYTERDITSIGEDDGETEFGRCGLPQSDLPYYGELNFIISNFNSTLNKMGILETFYKYNSSNDLQMLRYSVFWSNTTDLINTLEITSTVDMATGGIVNVWGAIR